MNNISTLANKIRDYVFLNYKQVYKNKCKNSPDEWNRYCVSIDTLGDTVEALIHFESKGLGNNDEEKYIKLYGVLQAVFLQQDSIISLYEIFVDKFENISLNIDDWKEIRELRNLTVGHPIEMKRAGATKRCFINRQSITSQCFQLMIWNKSKNKDEFEDIDFEKLYSNYKKEATAILEQIYSTLTT
ncbi:hypothetical protein CEE39_05300 [bacterium (candidate division B38) B3_B38]|nr:MAG: hypothetical protein CEE39_05300 [bacterium (candidate division B38) B3_B38]